MLLATVALLALWRGWNDKAIRYYCLTFLVGTIAVEGWGGEYDSARYNTLYFWAVFATTAVACWIGHCTRPVPLAGMGCVALGLIALANHPEQIMLLQSAWLSIPAMQCFKTTLGKLWAAQSILFFLYGIGVANNPMWWYWVGEWLPAVIVITAFVKIGTECHASTAKHQGNG